ncbi:ABC transporter substrate-binding protein [Phytohabitans sp. LJ34]|uniref:ABC transporter substrate-binding protein n=1 Tax=Phytohabitans sp. LJ34 TaxID=3452217 RepID=UPI003F88C7FB
MSVRARVLTALVAAASLALTACGGDSGDDNGGGGGGKTELKLYNDKGAWSPFFEELGKLSKQQIGIGMTPVGYTDEPTYSAFIKASFRTNEKPDLFTWSTGGRLQEIVEAGQVAETTDLWKEAIAAGDLSKELEETYTYGGKQYCVPLNISYWVMFYNKKVYDEAGLKPPTTWAELMSNADKLKAKGVTPFYQTSVLFSFVWFQQLLIGTNPDLYNKLATGEAKYTDPGVVAVMERWKQMIDGGYFSDAGSKEDPAVQLKSGKTAMGIFGTWFNTSMTQQGLKPGTDYGMFTIPNVDPAQSKVTMAFESGPLCSLAKAPDTKASDDYMKWWVRQPAQEKWANSRGDVSANPKVSIPDPGLSAIAKSAGAGEYTLANRYFEAAPAPVLTAALDAFGAFMVKPDSYMKQLENIQKAADEYWKGR